MVGWIHGVYMRNGINFWQHRLPHDCSWYRKALNKLKIGMEDWYRNDSYILTTSGKYSIRKSYNRLLVMGRQLDITPLIWTRVVLPKHRFILWLFNMKNLLTKSRLIAMGVHCDSAMCVLRDQHSLEDFTLLYTQCPWTKALWSDVSAWLGIQIPCIGVNECLIWLQKRRWTRSNEEVVTAVLGALVYSVWQARNWKIFSRLMHRRIVYYNRYRRLYVRD